MPIIESQSEVEVLVEIGQSFTATASGAVLRTLTCEISQSFSATARLSGVVQGETEVGTAFTATANGRRDGESDTFGEVQVEQAITATAQGRPAISGFVQIEQAITAVLTGTNTASEAFELEAIIDLLPAEVTGTYQEYRARLTVDGVELPIRDFRWVEDKQRFDDQLQVTLARVSDRTAITKNSSVKFEIGQKVAGILVWETLLDTGRVEGRNYAIQSGDRNAPGDVVTFTALSPMHVRLNTTAETNLVIYDPLKLTLEAADFDIIYDSDGRSYETELLPIQDLAMDKLFDEIIIERCGFANWQTNLPVRRTVLADRKWPLSRVDFRAGQPYIKTLAELIGMFDADLNELGDELWIRDTTVDYPSTFPTPPAVTVSRAERMGEDTEYKHIDGIEMTYQERSLDYDFTTVRQETDTSQVDAFGSVTETDTTTYIREYRRESQPQNIVYENTTLVTSETWIGNMVPTVLIEETTERFYYDGFGNLIERTREVWGRVPQLTNGNPLLQRIRYESESFDYRGHPWELDKYYMYRKTLTVSGLYIIDSDNPQFDTPWKREIVTAYRAGNLAAGQTSAFGPVRSIDERIYPRRDGTVRIKRTDIDHLSEVVTTTTDEERPGDIGRNPFVMIPKTMYVFEDDVYSRTTDKLEPLNVGELPLRFSVPLAKRKLKNLRTKPSRMGFDLVGWDNSLQKGGVFNPTDRAGNSLGVFSIEGRTITGAEANWSMRIEGKQLR